MNLIKSCIGKINNKCRTSAGINQHFVDTMIKEINSAELNIAFSTKQFKNRWIDNKAVENGDLLFSAAACNRTCKDLL